MLRTCAFYLYGWVCEDETAKKDADVIRSSAIPEGYPQSWPSPDQRQLLPPGTAPYTETVSRSISKQKSKIRAMLEDISLTNFPRDEVQQVLSFWKIEI
jgi:hypothetical protein